MPALTVSHIDFRSAFHLGDRGISLEESSVTLPSDTLFSALVDQCSRSGVDPSDFVAPFLAGNPPFLLTSAFPRVGGVYFFPAPVDLRMLLKDGTPDEGKRLKGIHYLSQGLFEKAIGGNSLDEWLPVENDTNAKGLLLQGGALWMMESERQQLPAAMRFVDAEKKIDRPHAALGHLPVWESQKQPHVTVDRITSGSTIFHVGRTWFAQERGLWFGIEWRTPDAPMGAAGLTWRALVKQLLEQLQDEGLGGERSGGSGQFCLKDDAATLKLADATVGQPAWLLSRVAPAAQDLPALLQGDKGVAYQLTSVAGWLRSIGAVAQRRKRIYLLAEGSWIAPPTPLFGCVRDVAPAGLPHKVYRYGLGLAVGGPQECTHG